MADWEGCPYLQMAIRRDLLQILYNGISAHLRVCRGTAHAQKQCGAGSQSAVTVYGGDRHSMMRSKISRGRWMLISLELADLG